MIGMDTVLKARQRGFKPSSVFVRLVSACSPPHDERHMGQTGVVTVQIPPGDSLGSLDFRPLKGLKVCVEDFTDDAARFDCVTSLILLARPEFIWRPRYDEAGQFHVSVERLPDPVLAIEEIDP